MQETDMTQAAREPLNHSRGQIEENGTNNAPQAVCEKEMDLTPQELGNEQDPRDFKKKQNFTRLELLWLAYQSIGVIYGDIGTSPLYVYSSTFTEEPSHNDLLGALSLIIWTLTIMVSIKYVLMVLRADDEGEGGTFAIYSLLSRYANIVRRDPREEKTIRMERTLSSDLRSTSKSTRSFLEQSAIMKTVLKIVGVFGVSLVMSDGVLTPAQSVLGAIQGLKVVDEGISQSTIVGTSCGILILLFLIQPLGTSKIASAFAPVVIIWLIFNMSFGIYNLVHFDHSVLKAFSPFFAGDYLMRNKTDGWRSLGGILLAFTGVEALFADLGAFSRSAIQISWLCFAYPCLLLAYIGQAAYISENEAAFSNPFFNSTPPGMFYPGLVMAVLAAIVASQTMITATFQLLAQIVKLSYFPQIKVVHTSRIFHGHIYIPWVNWLLMIGTVVVTAAYNNTTRLGQAYGVCVILVTFLTTSMVCLVAIIVWHVPLPLVLLGFLVFGSLDGLYLSSALTKVPEGAWFTLALGAFLSSIFVLWRYGKENQWRAEAADQLPLSRLFEQEDHSSVKVSSQQPLRLTTALGGAVISPIKGLSIFFDKTGDPISTPMVFVQFLQKFQATPAVAVFFHIRPISNPSVDPEERFTIVRCFPKSGAHELVQDFFQVTLRHGYTDEVVTPDLGMVVYEEIRKFIIRENVITIADVSQETSKNRPSAGTTTSLAEALATVPTETRQRQIAHNTVQQRLDNVKAAYVDQVTLIVGKEQMRIRESHYAKGWPRRIALAGFLWLRGNTGSRVANLNVDVDKLVEIGFVKVV